MTAVLDQTVITEPGVYDIPSEVYHAQRALSASGMRKLLPPNCPAIFRWEQDHRQAPKREFDLGHAAHRTVLGAGAELKVCDYPDWRTKAAQDEKKAAYADGLVPLLPSDMDRVKAMAAVVEQHPLASALFRGGRPEQSLFWTDQITGVPMRARLDWLSAPGASRLIVADYKTTTSVDLAAIERSVYEYGYNQQGAQYLDAVQALELGGDDAVFVFVFQMVTAPYLVRVVQLEQVALNIGRAKNRVATEIFRDCTESGIWPGYDEVTYAALPAYAERRETEEYL